MRIWEVLIFKLAKIYPDYVSTLDRHSSASSSLFICQMCSLHSNEGGVVTGYPSQFHAPFPISMSGKISNLRTEIQCECQTEWRKSFETFD